MIRREVITKEKPKRDWELYALIVAWVVITVGLIAVSVSIAYEQGQRGEFNRGVDVGVDIGRQLHCD